MTKPKRKTVVEKIHEEAQKLDAYAIESKPIVVVAPPPTNEVHVVAASLVPVKEVSKPVVFRMTPRTHLWGKHRGK